MSKAAEGVDDAAEDEDDEEEDDDDQDLVRIQRKQVVVFNSLRASPFKVVSLDQARIDQLDEQAAATDSVLHLQSSFSTLQPNEQALLGLIQPHLKVLDITVADHRKDEPVPELLVTYTFETLALQTAFSSPSLSFNKVEWSKFQRSVAALNNRSRDSLAATTNAIQFPSPPTVLDYAFANHRINAVSGLHQLIGTIGLVDEIIDSKGKVIKDIIPWLQAQLSAHHSASSFVVHPLFNMPKVAFLSSLSLDQYSLPENVVVVASIRKAVVELCNNIIKALALVAGFGLGVTASPLWSALCKAGSATLRHTVSEQWHLSTVLALLEDMSAPSKALSLPSNFVQLFDASPVQPTALPKWQYRLQDAASQRLTKSRGTISYVARSILAEGPNATSATPTYMVAMASPNLVVELDNIPEKSKLLTEWVKRSPAEKRKLAEYNSTILDLYEEDDAGDEEE